MDIIDLKKIVSVYLKLRKDEKKNKETIEALELSLKNILNTHLEVFTSLDNIEDLILLIETYDKLKSKDLKIKLLDLILNNKKEDLHLPFTPEPYPYYPRPFYTPVDPVPTPIFPNYTVICSTQENKDKII